MTDSITIDGPVASGKSTVARELARELRYLYLDTGAMYRAVTHLALQNGVGLDEEAALVGLLAAHQIALVNTLEEDRGPQLGYRVVVDGADVSDRIFEPDVAAAVSSVASLPGVRAALVDRQREIAREGRAVMAGRDIGTVVLPDARHKFFLTASLDERARRRRDEFRMKGLDIALDEVRARVEERDRIDTTRATSPLKAADDAVRIDSTGISAGEVVQRMLAAVRSSR